MTLLLDPARCWNTGGAAQAWWDDKHWDHWCGDEGVEGVEDAKEVIYLWTEQSVICTVLVYINTHIYLLHIKFYCIISVVRLIDGSYTLICSIYAGSFWTLVSVKNRRTRIYRRICNCRAIIRLPLLKYRGFPWFPVCTHAMFSAFVTSSSDFLRLQSWLETWSHVFARLKLWWMCWATRVFR